MENTVTDIVAFLTACLAEDEHVALFSNPDCAAEGWAVEETPGIVDIDVYVTTGRPVCERAGMAAAHIARHDPARVLRDIAAKRAILAEHHHAAVDDPEEPYPLGCNTCHYNAGDSVLRGFGWCRTVRYMAAVYADRPGYKEEWRPE